MIKHLKNTVHLYDFGYSEPCVFKYEQFDPVENSQIDQIYLLTDPTINLSNGYWDPIHIRFNNTDKFLQMLENQLRRQGIYYDNMIDDRSLTYKFGIKIIVYTKLESINSISYIASNEIILEDCWILDYKNNENNGFGYVDVYINFKNAFIRKKS